MRALAPYVGDSCHGVLENLMLNIEVPLLYVRPHRLLGIEIIAKGVDEPAGVGTIWLYEVKLNTLVVCTAGLAAGSSDSALASLPLACSKKTP